MGWKQLTAATQRGQLYVFDQGSIKDTANSHYLRIKAPAAAQALAL